MYGSGEMFKDWGGEDPFLKEQPKVKYMKDRTYITPKVQPSVKYTQDCL